MHRMRQTGIKRCQFDYHLDRVCPKALVECSAVDIRCPWQGRANQLSLHKTSCIYEQLREVLSELIAENNRLRKDNASLQTADATVGGHSGSTTDRPAQHTEATEQLQEAEVLVQNVICHRNQQLEQLIESTPVGLPMDLRRQELTNLNMTIVVQKAVIDRQCTELQLQTNPITKAGVSRLARGLRENTTLTKLNLSHNAMGDLGVPLLAHLLATNNTRIDRFYLCNIGMTDQGASYLADMLRTNTTLISLGIFRNRITDRGIQELFQTLAAHNKTLKHLYFASNSLVTDRSVDGLINMLSRNEVLMLIDMKRCGLSADGIERLKTAAKMKPNFTLDI